METLSPIIRAVLGLAAGAAVFALALARRGKRPRFSGLGLWSPLPARQSSAKHEATARAN